MNLPSLPEPASWIKVTPSGTYFKSKPPSEDDGVVLADWKPLHTEAQMLQLQRDTLEECAKLAEGHYGDGHRLAEQIRSMK